MHAVVEELGIISEFVDFSTPTPEPDSIEDPMDVVVKKLCTVCQLHLDEKLKDVLGWYLAWGVVVYQHIFIAELSDEVRRKRMSKAHQTLAKLPELFSSLKPEAKSILIARTA